MSEWKRGDGAWVREYDDGVSGRVWVLEGEMGFTLVRGSGRSTDYVSASVESANEEEAKERCDALHALLSRPMGPKAGTVGAECLAVVTPDGDWVVSGRDGDSDALMVETACDYLSDDYGARRQRVVVDLLLPEPPVTVTGTAEEVA